MPVVLLLSMACGDNRGGDVPAIRAALAALPGVRVIDVVGWDEMWPFFGPESVRADLQIGTTGRLLLCDLSKESVTTKGPFIIARVGNWAPLVRADRDMGKVRFVAGCPNSVDVKPGSAFLELIPFPLQSPGDAVANYARLHALIESWPNAPTRVKSKDSAGYVTYWKMEFRDEFVP